MKSVAKAVATLGIVGCAAINSHFAVADDSGWIAGFNAGQSRANIDDARITSELLGSGLATTSIIDNDRDTAYKIFGGYKFNKYFALEGGYFNLGEFSFTATANPQGTLVGNIKINGLNLDVVGTLPLAQKFSSFGRIGVQFAQVNDAFAGTGSVTVANPNPSESATNYKTGLGVQYDFTESVGLRAEWERYRINDAVGNRGDIDTLTVGLIVMFSGTTPVPDQQAPLLPPPTPVVRPIAIGTERYCTILDIQFEINQKNIQREEKEKLGVIATFLKKYPNTTAIIEGHTDNIGTAGDNMKLSQRRAESVVDDLVDRFHIARARLRAVGYGDSRPLTENRTEEGKRKNRRIGAVVACATDIEGLKPVPARITVALEMEFNRDKYDIRPKYRDGLKNVADFLKANPAVTATVEGHTSNLQTTPAAAMEISQRRAQTVVNYLVDALGVDRSRLSAEGFGETRRFAYNTRAEGQQENRRVSIILSYPN